MQLAIRDVSIHYKQTVIGAAWAVFRPLVTVVILTVVFRGVAKLEADGGAWYPLFVLVGMLPWQFFATILGESSNSLVSNANLVSKVYFPRLLVPLSTVGVPSLDLLVLTPFLAGMMLYSGTYPPWQIIFAPIFLLIAAVTSLGFGFGLCALNVKYRDVRYVMPFVLQFGVYVSPIGYSTAKVPVEFHWFYYLNPMAFVIDGLRWSLLGVGSPFASWHWLLSLSVSLLGLLIGLRYFRRTERTFADVI